jgi:hypothetical protein
VTRRVACVLTDREWDALIAAIDFRGLELDDEGEYRTRAGQRARAERGHLHRALEKLQEGKA